VKTSVWDCIRSRIEMVHLNGEDGDRGTEVKTVDRRRQIEGLVVRCHPEYTKYVFPTSSGPNRGGGGEEKEGG
jgi:hypothetical protein